MSTLSPNMSLVIPTVGSDYGPNYAAEINQSLTTLDQHNHTAGSGVLITPAAIDINTALTFNSNFATNLAGLTLVPQGSTPSANGTIYMSGNDLYYNNGAGTVIQITNSSGVAVTPTSIPGLVSPASATYVPGSSTFVWQSNTSIAANLDAGSLLLRNLSPNSTYAVTLSPPAGLSSNSTITLPSNPTQTNLVTMNTAGTLAANANVDGSTLAFSGTTLSVATGGITTTQISSSANITGSQLSSTAGIAGGQIASSTVAVSNMASTTFVYASSSGAATNGGGSIIAVTNQAVGFTPVANRPVFIQFIGDSNASTGYNGMVGNLSTNASSVAQFFVYRDGTLLAQYSFPTFTAAGCACLNTVDFNPTATGHTYTLKFGQNSGGNAYAYGVHMLVFQL